MIVNLKSPHSNFFERTDTLVRYYEDIRKYDILSYEDEIKLFHLIRKGNKKEREAAKKIIINSNQRFVVAMAKRFGTNDNILDLINEGNLGLIEAMDNFDETKGHRFITFAVHYVRREINNYCINYGNIVKRNNLSKTYHVIAQATNKFIQTEYRKPSVEELKDILNDEYDLDIKNVSDIIDTKIMYIDEKYGDDDDNHDIGDSSLFNDYSASSNGAELKATKEFNSKLVNSMLNKLTEREATIIKYFFGIGYDREYELQEISKKMNLTTERVRQLKNSSIKKLKSEYQKALNVI